MISIIKQFEHLKIQLEAIKSATNDFAEDNCIGKGGFGKVYKGELVQSNGHVLVAIKRLDRAFGQGDPEFWKEIIMLSLYRHENIICLLGFCDDGGEKILVYEYSSKHSLDLHLNSNDLTWVRRLRICIGAAKGLAYLHHPGGSQQRLLHRDIKSSNILLDENWDARISDFGLSKFGPANQRYTFLVSNAVGTVGYCDPLYVETGLLTKESDVYSLGVVLFEVLCGRLSTGIQDKRKPLTGLARSCYEHNTLNEIIYGGIKDEINPDSLRLFTTIAYRCLKIDHEQRPLMDEIVTELETALKYQIEKGHQSCCPEGGTGGTSYGSRPGDQPTMVSVQPKVSHLGWGHLYTLRELEIATNGFSDEKVIGEGGYGIVYSGFLMDNTSVAVKNLLSNRGQAEKEFKVEVEAIGRVRHKNLVRLLGYCAEGAHRILVYEYVNNGNLEQWLHGDVGSISPLTWEIRMHIILGTAKGLTYLHEGLDPKVVHGDIKSSNILLDRQWHPKVSDFGLAKLLGSEKSYVTTRVMGTFGYVAPEYASTGMLNERSDVYSFGILIMEIISGRNPVDYSKPADEVNLVDWLKTMVTNRNAEGVLDPKLGAKPSSRALKRALLVALRCVDPSAQKRPKMGHVIHMLEADDFPFRDEHRGNRERLMEKRYVESGDSSGYESSMAHGSSSHL